MYQFSISNLYQITSSANTLANDGSGNPAPAIVGAQNSIVNVLSIVRSGGGLFTFDGAEVAQFNFGLREVRFRGVLGGALQNTADLNTTAIDNDFAGGSQGSGLLNGVSIDELLVELESVLGASILRLERVDNIRLTLVNETPSGVPAPATLALLGLGLAGLGWSRRLRH